MKEIYIIRHGETDYNRQGIVQGKGVNSSINEKGVLQAEMFHNQFKNIKFDHLLASTLQRTQQTLQPFVNDGYDLKLHEELDEINWGIHEGRKTTPILQNQYEYITTGWRNGNVDLKIEQGESPRELQERQLRFINTILPNYDGKILVCTHGRAMRSLLCTMLEKPLSEMDSFPHTNLSLYKMNQQESGVFEIDWFNYLEHLK